MQCQVWFDKWIFWEILFFFNVSLNLENYVWSLGQLTFCIVCLVFTLTLIKIRFLHSNIWNIFFSGNVTVMHLNLPCSSVLSCRLETSQNSVAAIRRSLRFHSTQPTNTRRVLICLIMCCQCFLLLQFNHFLAQDIWLSYHIWCIRHPIPSHHHKLLTSQHPLSHLPSNMSYLQFLWDAPH